MPYISKEEVKNIRESLKKEFGKTIKFSVTKRDSNEVCVAILESVEDFSDILESKDRKYTQLNTFYLGNYGENHFKTLSKIMEIIQKVGNHKNCEFEDADYGNIPTFYISLDIGKWDKDWKIKEV